MKKLTLLGLLVSFFLLQCTKEKPASDDSSLTSDSIAKSTAFTYDSTKVKVGFTAYKLPGEKKTGVKGQFKSFHLEGVKQATTPEEILSNTQFTVHTESVSTNDLSRDGKVKEFFFGKMLNFATIKGNFGTFKDNKVTTTIEMNGQTVTKEFSYELDNRVLIISGTIDVVEDFKAAKSLEAITEACKDLHEGKTWPDVDIQVNIEL